MRNLTEKEIAIVLHTLGLSAGGVESYRNHFVASPGHHDMPTLESLVAKGVMTEGVGPEFLGPRSLFFFVNPEWVIKAETYAKEKKSEEEAKLTRSQRRYRRYLASDGVFNSFRDFLRYESAQARR